MEFYLPPRQQRDLSDAVAVSPDVLERVLAVLTSLDRLMIPEGLEHEVRDAGAGDSASAVVRTIINSQTALDSSQLVPEESQQGEWEESFSLLSKIANLPAVQLARKALDLSYEYANLLSSVRIVTDMRPIYGNEVTRIDGCVISQTLRVRYSDVNGPHEISVAIDQNDIRELQIQCERALEKAKTAHQFLSSANVSSIITGDDDAS